MSNFRLSVLDQSPVPENLTGSEALRNSVDLAGLCDSLGYHRYWVAEHHGTPGLACASPEALIPAIASVTDRIRVGSGGIMLPHYSPLKVAETFSMLAGLFPHRIDLGIGRAAGTDSRTAHALQRDRSLRRTVDDFPDQLDELLGYLWQRIPDSHPFHRYLATLPGRPEVPDVHLLGSSPQSGIWAASRGLPYCFADFIAPYGAELAHHYRSTFQPSGLLDRPYVGVAVWAICADSDDEADHLAASFKMMMILMHQGQLIAVPHPDKAAAYLASLGHDPFPLARRILTGSPTTLRPAIESVAAEYEADEVFLVNIVYDHEARRRSYEFIADAFDLTVRPSTTATPTSPR